MAFANASSGRGCSTLGDGGTDRLELANLQRARLIAAATGVVEELGYGRLTVSQVIDRARVSRRTFYDIFASREDCFVGILEQALSQPRQHAIDIYRRQASWREGLRAALETILVLMEEQPGLARLCVIEALAGGPRVLSFRTALMREIAGALDLGRSESSALREPPAITAEAIAGGVFSVLHNKLCGEREQSFVDLLGPLMNMMTLPYLGARVAAEELKKPIRELARENGHRSGPEIDPFQELGIRLTYRTVRTLLAIAERPGASNRDVAAAAGIADQGQVSKLVNRLCRLQLIENTGAGHSKGAANAWWLTERGERLCPQAWSY